MRRAYELWHMVQRVAGKRPEIKRFRTDWAESMSARRTRNVCVSKCLSQMTLAIHVLATVAAYCTEAETLAQFSMQGCAMFAGRVQAGD